MRRKPRSCLHKPRHGKDKRHCMRLVGIWVCIFLWGLLAVFLSRQNGTETAALSYGISEKLAAWLGYWGLRPSVAAINRGIRKAAHILIYLMGGGLVYDALICTFGWRPGASLIPAAVLCLAASTLDELQKLFIPGRHCDPEEILLNGAAGVVGIAIRYFLYTKQNHKHNEDGK